MEQEIIFVLQSPKSQDTIYQLCEKANILPFQANMLIDMFQSIEKHEADMEGLDTSNLQNQKWEIVNGLCNGLYSDYAQQENDFRQCIISNLQIGNIQELCNLTLCDEETIKSLCEQYQTVEKYEAEMVGLDTSNLLRQKWDIINELTATLEKQKGVYK